MSSLVNTNQGFSLLELLVALAIVGVLVAVAMPGFGAHKRRVLASQGALSLLDLAGAQERLRLSRGRYQPADVLLARRSLPKHVARHYQLEVELDAEASRYLMSLSPVAVGEGWELISLDSTGRRQPASAWP